MKLTQLAAWAALPIIVLAACDDPAGVPLAEPAVSPAAAGKPCPGANLPYPRPEPDYDGKLARDFGPFAAPLAAYRPAQVIARTELVGGKTILELQALMASGELTSADLTVYYLERIRRYDVDKLNSVIELNPDALAIAQALDDERAAGSVRGPLHGIPVLLKDNIATGDRLHTAAGAAAMLDWHPSRDAFLVKQLREAGAVILGKGNLSEWANYLDPCLPNGFSANGGQTRNPYGPFETYGSSSGSAVAVAADLVAVAVGSETQGSIIMPAGINSVVGLKPTKGLISADYVIPLLPFQDTTGPMGRTVTDVAILLSAMTGVDTNDLTTNATVGLAGVDFTQYLNATALQGVRVGIPVWDDQALAIYFADKNLTDQEKANLGAVLKAQSETVRVQGAVLAAAGATVVEVPQSDMPSVRVDLPPLLEYGFREALNQFLTGLGPEAPVASLADIIAFNNADPANRAPYGQGYLEAAQNTTITAEEFTDRQQLASIYARNAIDIVFEHYDLDVIVSSMVQLYATAGYPALSVPDGFDEHGAPQGVVFVGRFMSEPQLLAAGYAYEQGTQARVAPDLEATMRSIEVSE